MNVVKISVCDCPRVIQGRQDISLMKSYLADTDKVLSESE